MIKLDRDIMYILDNVTYEQGGELLKYLNKTNPLWRHLTLSGVLVYSDHTWVRHDINIDEVINTDSPLVDITTVFTNGCETTELKDNSSYTLVADKNLLKIMENYEQS